MNKIRNLLFIVFFAICSTSLVIVAEEEVIEEEVKGPSNPQELLEIVRQGKFADSEEQKDRESRFNADKGKQTPLLANAKATRARLERIAAQLEKTFEANEALLVVAEAQLKDRLGSLTEIFGHLAGTATEARNIFEQSITAAQFGKDREEFLTGIAVKMGEGIRLPSISELERLWFELQREINASGEVVMFTSDVIATEGSVQETEGVRVGNFNAVTDGQYLAYAASRGMYEELPAQPAGRYTSTTSEVFDEDAFLFSLLLTLLDLKEALI